MQRSQPTLLPTAHHSPPQPAAGSCARAPSAAATLPPSRRRRRGPAAASPPPAWAAGQEHEETNWLMRVRAAAGCAPQQGSAAARLAAASPGTPAVACRPAWQATSPGAEQSTAVCTSPVISTNSCLALTTTQTGTLASRALISSGLNPRSKSGCAERADAARGPAGGPPPRRALTDCRQERRRRRRGERPREGVCMWMTAVQLASSPLAAARCPPAGA